MLDPMETVLEATRSAKAAIRFVRPQKKTKKPLTYRECRKIFKRIDDLLRESAALQENVIPQLVSLANVVTTAVDFGIQVRWESKASQFFN